MKKNKALFEILAHIIGWLIFLSFPIWFSPEPPQELQSKLGHFYLLPLFFHGFILIMLFYFNYFILIPKYLFSNRYLVYSLFCLLCICIMMLSPALLMTFFHKPDAAMMTNPPVKKGMPMVFTNSILMFMVTFLASIVLRLNNRWRLAKQERLQSELSSLKSQINPHFLFNTLNSIYAETLGKADNASEMLLKLSDMMRYTTTEVHHDKVSLQKEFDYVTNYIELQKLRLASKAKLEYLVEGDAAALQIAPFLLIPFIENAFKYGVNSQQDSSIIIDLRTNNAEVNLTVFNKKVETEKTLQEASGLGIKNTRQRLLLIYPGKHILTIDETENDYSVSLYINLA